MDITVTVHYPNGFQSTFFDVPPWSRIWTLNERYGFDTGVYSRSETRKNGYFEVVEVSGDKRNVWVEFVEC